MDRTLPRLHALRGCSLLDKMGYDGIMMGYNLHASRGGSLLDNMGYDGILMGYNLRASRGCSAGRRGLWFARFEIRWDMMGCKSSRTAPSLLRHDVDSNPLLPCCQTHRAGRRRARRMRAAAAPAARPRPARAAGRGTTPGPAAASPAVRPGGGGGGLGFFFRVFFRPWILDPST